MLRGICLTTALTLLAAGSAPAPAFAAEAAPERAPLGVSVTPPECVTKSLFNPPTLPTWTFVVNFEVISGSAPLGCLAVYNAAPPDVFHSIPCQTVGPVTYFNGLGLFQGGRVECPIDLDAYLTSPPISNSLPTLMMQGVGRLSPTEASTSPFRSPIVFYTPTLAATGTGLFLRAAVTGTLLSGSFRTTFNGRNYESFLTRPFTVTLTDPMAQTWTTFYTRSAGTNLPIVANAVNGLVFDTMLAGDIAHPVSFQSDGGVFIVGGSPFGPNLLGTLEEVIVDPAGGSEPPKVPQAVPLTVTQISLPVGLR